MIATVTLNPALDRSIHIDSLRPSDTNRIREVETDAGGKGINASRVLKELGSETVALGFIGGSAGEFIEHVLRREGIRTDFVHIDGETRTNIAVQEESGAPPTTFNEVGPAISADELDELSTKVRRISRKSSMVIFGGSLTPGAPPDTYKKLVGIAQDAGARAILDSDGEPMCLGMEAAPFMIKPNLAETRRLVGVDIASNEDALHAANLFMEYGVQLAVISMGAKGAVAVFGNEAWKAVPPQVEVVSTIGSGDSMVAGIAHIISAGGSLEEALKWGTAAGAATAMTTGAEISNRAQIVSLLDKIRMERIK